MALSETERKRRRVLSSQAWYARNKDKVRAYWKQRTAEQRADPAARDLKNTRYRRWYAQAHEHRERIREKNTWLRYGLTHDDIDNMLRACGFRCVCGAQIDELSKRIDHSHKTEKVRGLLCNNCNRAIGLLGDDPIALRALADYLERAGDTDCG